MAGWFLLNPLAYKRDRLYKYTIAALLEAAIVYNDSNMLNII